MNSSGNRIPRQFNRIAGRMLIKTNMDEPGDLVYVYKQYDGYQVLNKRTGKYASCFVSMLRNVDYFKIEEII